MNILTQIKPVRLIKLLLLVFIITTACKEKKVSKINIEGNNTTESFNKNPLYESRVVTKPKEFPSGIEGPAYEKGILYAVNYGKPGTIGQMVENGIASLFVDLPEGSTGNGIRFNNQGAMLIADYTGHNVLKVDMQSKEISVYAHNAAMNQPNDLAISDHDIVFASDPDWKNSKGQIWRIDTDGTSTLLESDMGTTNGIEVSPDNKTLYVNESVQRNVWAYDLSPKGEISNKRLLLKFEDFGMDGMRTDIMGNLYITRHGKGTVVKVSPEGAILKEISLTGKTPSNIAFGGVNGTTAFITLQDNGNIEAFEVEHPGRAFALKKHR
jgi:sugar lactone lactonase YvrE